MKIFHPSQLSPLIRRRLPSGTIYFDLVQSVRQYRYGARATALRFLRCLSVYCLGCRFARKNRPIAELRPPYPVLYHFTPEANVESIKKTGLVTGKSGAVYMTDWLGLFAGKQLACFQIDTERLLPLGHRVNIMSVLYEFTTDAVPPECLTYLPKRE